MSIILAPITGGVRCTTGPAKKGIRMGEVGVVEGEGGYYSFSVGDTLDSTQTERQGWGPPLLSSWVTSSSP